MAKLWKWGDSISKIELKGPMDLSVQTPVGPIQVRWSTSGRYRPAAIVRAPFLLEWLKTGWTGFKGLAIAINNLAEENRVEETAEFLKLAAIGKSAHWLELMERKGLETALDRVKARMEECGLSSAIEFATRLRDEKCFFEDDCLYVLGKGESVHMVDVSAFSLTDHYRFFYSSSLSPSKIARLFERSGEGLDRYFERLRNDYVARRRFREFLEASGQPWARELLTRLVGKGLE